MSASAYPRLLKLGDKRLRMPDTEARTSGQSFQYTLRPAAPTAASAGVLGDGPATFTTPPPSSDVTPPQSSSAPRHQSRRAPHGGVTMADLELRFNMPMKAAAADLNVCLSLLKKICRQYGISRWPHRKIQAHKKDMGIDDLSTADMVAMAKHDGTRRDFKKVQAENDATQDAANALLFAAQGRLKMSDATQDENGDVDEDDDFSTDDGGADQ